MDYSGLYLVNLFHLMTISGGKRPDWGLFGASKWLVCNEITLWGPLVVPRQAQKWVIDTDLVNIGQLDHYVVF